MTIVELATNVLNGFASVLFLILVGAAGVSMLKRIVDFRRAGQSVPVLLRSNFGLLMSLVIIGGESLILRALGVAMEVGSLERLAFSIQADFILLVGLAYYTKVELFDVDNEETK